MPPSYAGATQEMVALDRLAPQTWCVLGNCFSLQREFETAIKFFHRAIQVDATFTYAYTLAGHEHVSNEDFDKATASFRDALRYDQRHYNAWSCLVLHVACQSCWGCVHCCRNSDLYGPSRMLC